MFIILSGKQNDLMGV